MANTRGIKRERHGEGYIDGDEGSGGRTSVSPSPKRGKFERSFVPSWLDRFEWLMFDSHRNLMFCEVCRKYKKNNAFTEGCQNFRRDNLNKHVATNDHKFCVEQEGLNKSTCHADSTKATVPAEAATGSPLTQGRQSSSDSCRSSGIFSSASNSLPHSPASMPLPSPPTFAPSRTPSSSIHAPVPILPYPPLFTPYLDTRYAHYGEPNGDAKCKDNLPITPNYIAHPPFPYASSSSNFQPAESPQTPREKSSTPVQNHVPASNASPPRGGTNLDDNELVLKVRVANSVEQDFIEIEIDRSRLNFEFVLSTVCRELNVNPSVVHKLRKLPNTIVRKDKDVRRFVDFQELELVLTNRANSESSRNYGPPSVSPRHVDVVY